MSVKCYLNGHPFRGSLEPDGQGSHWLKVSPKVREAAGVKPGGLVTLEMLPLTKEGAPRLPSGSRTALAAAPKAHAVWSDITPIARRDWIAWITSARQAKTRVRRIRNACDVLAWGKRRVCCFDRSGIHSQAIKAPQPAK